MDSGSSSGDDVFPGGLRSGLLKQRHCGDEQQLHTRGCGRQRQTSSGLARLGAQPQEELSYNGIRCEGGYEDHA